MKRNSPSPNHPYCYGSTKVSRDRFWWCVWDGWINMHAVVLPDAWGEAPTRETAETAAHAAAKHPAKPAAKPGGCFSGGQG